MTPEETEGGQRYSVGTVERAFSLLERLAELQRPARLPELTQLMGLSKASVYRLLRTLMELGAVRQVAGEGYTLGPALISVGQSALRATQLPELARPHMDRLHEQLGESIVLSVLDHDEIVYVDRIEAQQILSTRAQVGAKLPAYCTASGQVLLAGLDDSEVVGRLARSDLVAHAPNTLTSVPELLARLEVIRRNGFAINDEELEVGHRAASAPVRDHTDLVAAALSISVPAARVSIDELTRFAREALVPAARALSADLGSSTGSAEDAA
jgi:IclR family pca regulon transcriptional regulator